MDIAVRRLSLIGCILAASLSTPALADASLRLRPFASNVGWPVSTDGSRLITWPAPGDPATVTLANLRTHRTTTRAAPQRCALGGIAKDASVLWSCPRGLSDYVEYGLVQSLTSARAPVVLPAGRSLSGAPPDAGEYSALGTRWARYTISGYHYAYHVFISRRTGRQARPDDNDLQRVVDLDSPALSRRLCSGLKRPMVPDAAAGVGLEPGLLATAGEWGAAMDYSDTRSNDNGSVVLQRCGHRPRVVQRCLRLRFCSLPVIDGRIVAWIVTGPGTPARSRVFVRELRTGRTRSLATSLLSGPPVLVRGRLFVLRGTALDEVRYRP